MQKTLTTYAASNREMTMTRRIHLREALIIKYNDGYVKDEKGKP